MYMCHPDEPMERCRSLISLGIGMCYLNPPPAFFDVRGHSLDTYMENALRTHISTYNYAIIRQQCKEALVGL